MLLSVALYAISKQMPIYGRTVMALAVQMEHAIHHAPTNVHQEQRNVQAVQHTGHAGTMMLIHALNGVHQRHVQAVRHVQEEFVVQHVQMNVYQEQRNVQAQHPTGYAGTMMQTHALNGAHQRHVQAVRHVQEEYAFRQSVVTTL
jgi:hypothetical protein